MKLFNRRRSSFCTAHGRKSSFRLHVESLEGRTLLSLAPIDFGSHRRLDTGGHERSHLLHRNDITHGNELWKSDGTAGGTVMVKDINPGALGSNPSSLTVVGSTLFFAATDGVHGPELWKSDGTAAGTVMVKDVYPGAVGSYPKNMANVNGTLFYQAFDPSSGYELFRSDGTSAGTYMVKDIYPGYSGSFPANLTAVGSTVFFAANDGMHGTELWKSDGLPEPSWSATSTRAARARTPGSDERGRHALLHGQ